MLKVSHCLTWLLTPHKHNTHTHTHTTMTTIFCKSFMPLCGGCVTAATKRRRLNDQTTAHRHTDFCIMYASKVVNAWFRQIKSSFQMACITFHSWKEMKNVRLMPFAAFFRSDLSTKHLLKRLNALKSITESMCVCVQVGKQKREGKKRRAREWLQLWIWRYQRDNIFWCVFMMANQEQQNSYIQSTYVTDTHTHTQNESLYFALCFP